MSLEKIVKYVHQESLTIRSHFCLEQNVDFNPTASSLLPSCQALSQMGKKELHDPGPQFCWTFAGAQQAFSPITTGMGGEWIRANLGLSHTADAQILSEKGEITWKSHVSEDTKTGWAGILVGDHKSKVV